MAESRSPIITLRPGARSAILAVMEGKHIQRPLRVDLNFSGCCDPSLCLCADDSREEDFIEEIEGLTFIINPKTYDLAGNITISYIDEPGRKGFRIQSAKPMGEWEGFGVCDIKC